jgi:hypothetical protein
VLALLARALHVGAAGFLDLDGFEKVLVGFVQASEASRGMVVCSCHVLDYVAQAEIETPCSDGIPDLDGALGVVRGVLDLIAWV